MVDDQMCGGLRMECIQPFTFRTFALLAPLCPTCLVFHLLLTILGLPFLFALVPDSRVSSVIVLQLVTLAWRDI